MITNAIWTNYGVYNISQFDNDEEYVIARNDESNDFNPCAWSRFDWTYDGEDLYYCQTAYDAERPKRLRSRPSPPTLRRSAKGCGAGTSAWTKLTPQ